VVNEIFLNPYKWRKIEALAVSNGILCLSLPIVLLVVMICMAQNAIALFLRVNLAPVNVIREFY
jgi:hypothetical protein